MNRLYNTFLKSSGISTDTRKITKNNLFFALSGSNFNGNFYAKLALENGAIAVVVDDPDFYIESESYYFVENSLLALQELAALHRSKLNAKLIALTGSNGKTTTKELIAAVLSKKFKTQCTKGNFNNHIGVPLTILECEVDSEFLVVEMGANQQKEIGQLCVISDPDYGLITNIGKAHLEGFGGIEGVKKGKKELYDYLVLKDKAIFIDISDVILNSLLPINYIESINYNKLDFRILPTDKYLKLSYKNNIISTKLSGKYNIGNIAAAVTIGEYFNIDLLTIIKAIENYIPDNNRSEYSIINGITVFKDAYNANPTSMKLSLENFIDSHDTKDSILIIGDMLELGEYSEQEHRLILNFLSNYDFETYVIGSEFIKLIKLYPAFKFFHTISDLKSELNLKAFLGKSVFLKGSRGVGLEKLFS